MGPALKRQSLVAFVTGAVAAALPAQQLVRDINQTPLPPSQVTMPSFTLSDGARVFFDGTTTDSGTELWVTDGTVNGTRMVRDLAPGLESGGPEPVLFRGQTLLLATHNYYPTIRDALWISDGTSQGTVPLVNGLNSPGQIQGLGVVQGRAVFSGRGTTQLWSSDLTPAGTQVIAACGVESSYAVSALLGNLIVFAGNGDPAGNEPWVTDGTAAGTFRLADVNPNGSSGPDRFTRLGNVAFFLATNAANQTELWRSDGTAAGTTLVLTTPVARAPTDERLVAVGSHLAAVLGGALWGSDGTANGTQQLLPPAATGPVDELVSDGAIAFAVRGAELWRTDGTPAGTNLITNITPGTGNSHILDRATVQQGILWLSVARTGSPFSCDLVRSDGTAAGTTLLNISGWVVALQPLGSRILLTSTPLVSGTAQMLVTDGTAAGTVNLLPALAPRPGIRVASSVAMDGVLYMVLNDGTHGYELWRSDGTVAGTRIVADLNTNPGGSSLSANTTLIALDGALYFTADTPATGLALWRSDGTAAGTTVL
jgi:ELWxxDGT repeat protein